MTKRRNNKHQGFTLIEILIVMLIISIAGGLTLLTISNNHNTQLKTFTQQLTNIFNLAEEQAMLQPATLGLSLTKHALQFSQLDEQSSEESWAPITSGPLSLKSIPAYVTLTLKTETPKKSRDSTDSIPSIIISSSGDITPFKILVGKKNGPPIYEINGESNGSVSSHLVKNDNA